MDVQEAAVVGLLQQGLDVDLRLAPGLFVVGVAVREDVVAHPGPGVVPLAGELAAVGLLAARPVRARNPY